LEDLTLPLCEGLGGYSGIVASGLASIRDEKKRADVASKARDFIGPSMGPLDRLSVVKMLALTSSDKDTESVCGLAKKILQEVPGLFEGEYARLLLNRLRETFPGEREAKVDRFLVYVSQCIKLTNKEVNRPEVNISQCIANFSEEGKDNLARTLIKFLYRSEDGERMEIAYTLRMIELGRL